jgi:hypothetical protein
MLPPAGFYSFFGILSEELEGPPERRPEDQTQKQENRAA